VDFSSLTISDIKSIPEGWNELIRNKSRIVEIVELPLVKACEVLYDKNVRTLESSANSTNIGGFARICIDYNSLTVENQKIANNFLHIDVGGDTNISATIKILITSPDIPISVISNKVADIANRFKKQPLTWTKIYTWYKLSKIFLGYIDIKACREKDPKLFNNIYYYDEENDVFFESKEHYYKLKKTYSVFKDMIQKAKYINR